MIVIMAGLPATGKSTLARRLAAELDGLVVDKDEVRAALFSGFVDYTKAQDDLAMECVYTAAGYVARTRPDAAVFIDGRTFVARRQWARALDFVRTLGAPWRVIETACSDNVGFARLAASAGHPAANRSSALYSLLKAGHESIEVDKLVVDTERPIEECVKQCLAYLLYY